MQLNLPSLRLDSFSGSIVQGNRKSSLTFAPEAGTQRLRDVINKNVTEEDIFRSLSQAFAQGYSSVKLYFMLGLPTETMQDVEGIVRLAAQVKQLYRTVNPKGRGVRVAVSCSTFIPKPFTPFQWCGFASREHITQCQRYLSEQLKKLGVSFAYNDYDSSLLEAVLAKGGRSVADALYRAYLNGARFDAWTEHFRYDCYKSAFEQTGVDVLDVVGERQVEDVLPWDFVDVGVTKRYLRREYDKALCADVTPSCTAKCNGCGLRSWGFCTQTQGNKKL